MRKYGNVMIALLLSYSVLFIIILGFFVPPGEIGISWGQEMFLISFVSYIFLFWNDKRFGLKANPWAAIVALIFGPPMLLTILTMYLFRNKIDWLNSGYL